MRKYRLLSESIAPYDLVQYVAAMGASISLASPRTATADRLFIIESDQPLTPPRGVDITLTEVTDSLDDLLAARYNEQVLSAPSSIEGFTSVEQPFRVGRLRREVQFHPVADLEKGFWNMRSSIFVPSPYPCYLEDHVTEADLGLLPRLLPLDGRFYTLCFRERVNGREQWMPFRYAVSSIRPFTFAYLFNAELHPALSTAKPWCEDRYYIRRYKNARSSRSQYTMQSVLCYKPNRIAGASGSAQEGETRRYDDIMYTEYYRCLLLSTIKKNKR